MARRGRQSGLKALGPGTNQKRNKNPKLSPYQRELKRIRLSNQAPRPFVNASASSGKNDSNTPVTADNMNPTLMYQKRDTPAKARGLMKFLQDKEDRALERKQAKAETDRKQQEAEEEQLAFRERYEDSDYDSEEGEEREGLEEDEEAEEMSQSDDDEAFDQVEESDNEMNELLGDLEDAVDGNASDSEIMDEEKQGNSKVTGNNMVLTQVPPNPSGKQLKAWMVKKDRLSYLEMKEKGDISGCEELLKKVLISQGFTFVDPKPVEKNDKKKDFTQKRPYNKRQRGKPILEGELSAPLTDLNEEMQQQMAPNLASVSLGSNSKAPKAGSHEALMAEAAMINLKLLKKKEKKHAKKSEKRRERTMDEMTTVETELTNAMNKKLKKKVRKEKLKEGDANYKLHQKLTNMQIENLKAGIGAKRSREDGDGHDPNYLLPFQVYEQQQQKNKVKRLSGLDESQIQMAIDIEDTGKMVEKIQFGDRAVAPPVFSVVPSMSNSFAKFAMNLQKEGGKKAAPTTRATNGKVNGVVTSSGGIRSQQNKPGKAKEMSLSNKTILKNALMKYQQEQNSNIISTAPRVDSTGDISLYERKRLAKLGLMGPVTEQRINRSSLVNGGEGNSSHNASEMEMLRQRVMSTYRGNKKIRKDGGKVASSAPSSGKASGMKSWMPTDRDY